MPLRLCLTGNEPRQRYLFSELERACQVHAVIQFEKIDPITKLLAAGLSFSRPRSEWWENYHMHPLLQHRRRTVLLHEITRHLSGIDALLMWGSWFQPFPERRPAIPAYHYIDQSHSLANLPGEPRGRFARRKRAHALQSETYEAAAAIFCMSHWARQQTIEAHKVDPSKVISVGWGPCGIDLSAIAEPSAEREPLVLHVSNDFYRKGVDYLIQTAERVCTAIPEARFVVVGRDSSRLKLPASSRVEFLGPIYDKGQLTDLFQRASVFFLPHRFDRSPHVLVEAMSARLPLVATRQGGAIELIDNQGTGYLCTPGSITEYADAVVTLLRNPDLRSRMGERGNQLMRERYNWKSVAQRMIQRMERSHIESRAGRTAPLHEP